jgi:predicted AAA+ superfamily ATPase
MERMERVLELGEELLRRRLGASPAPGFFAEHLAFRWEASAEGGWLEPVRSPRLFDLADLIGVESGVEALLRNTEQFMRGLPSNHVLLFGERGTGKSSAVRGLLSRFGDRGLRVIEVHKEDLMHLPRILDALRGAPHRFLIFCDDLSFDAGERGHRELKAALEGSFEAPAENVCVVVTSNRRHLLPESLADADPRLDEHGDLHLGEVVEEKMALSDRFGLLIGFYAFDQATYLRIVDRWAERCSLEAPRADLHREALTWSVRRASRSGRTARQFVDDYAGRVGLD